MFSTVTVLDMNISQFLKSLGLDHLRDIFEREQVSGSIPLLNSLWSSELSCLTLGFSRLLWTCWLTWATRS